MLTPSNQLQIKLTKDNYLSQKTAININGNNILNHIDVTTIAPPQFIPSPSSLLSYHTFSFLSMFPIVAVQRQNLNLIDLKWRNYYYI